MSWRPWTESAKRLKYMKGVKRKLPEPLKRWNIVRGDTVSDGAYENWRLNKSDLGHSWSGLIKKIAQTLFACRLRCWPAEIKGSRAK